MLLLSRKEGEEIVIGGNVVVRIGRIGRGRVKVVVLAPPTVRVDRGEICDLLRGSFWEEAPSLDGTLRMAPERMAQEEEDENV